MSEFISLTWDEHRRMHDSFEPCYADPGASYYEERYKQRVVHNLHRRAKELGFVLVEANAVGVS